MTNSFLCGNYLGFWDLLTDFIINGNNHTLGQREETNE